MYSKKVKLYLKLFGNILNFASVKFHLNLFFLRNAYSNVATNFANIVFIQTNATGLKVKTFSSIWKNFSKFFKFTLIYIIATILVITSFIALI